MTMIVVKNQIRDLVAYLEEADVKSLEKGHRLETRIYEEGRKEMSFKRLRIWMDKDINSIGYARKNKNHHTTLYKVCMSPRDYELFTKEGELIIRVSMKILEGEKSANNPEGPALEYAYENQDIRVKYVGKMSSYYQEKYERCKKSLDQITNSQ